MDSVLSDHQQTDRHGFPVADLCDVIDRRGVMEVSLRLLHSYGVTMPQVVENAGRTLAALACRRYLHSDALGRRVVVLIGAGGIAASALTAARRLSIWGAAVRLVVARGAYPLSGLAARQMAVLAALGVLPQELPEVAPDLIIDAMSGYDPDEAPRGRRAALTGWANAVAAPVLALEAPTGSVGRWRAEEAPPMFADATLMLGMPKSGLTGPEREAAVGAIYLGDISIPGQLWRSLSVPLRAPSFARGDILRIRRPGERISPAPVRGD